MNYLVSHIIPKDIGYDQKKNYFLHDARSYFCEEPLLYKHCTNGVICKCVPEGEGHSFLLHCHSLKIGGHFSTSKTIVNVWQSEFY